MSRTAFVVVLVFLSAGTAFGWHANRSYSANSDVKSTKRKLPGYRRIRRESGLIAIALGAMILLLIIDMAKVG